MSTKPCFYIASLLAASLLSCANSADVDVQAKNQFVTEFYALVTTVEKVKFKSYAGEGAAIGAVDGALSNARGDAGDMLAGAIVGGFFGGLITSLFEGSNIGYEYQLQAVDGDSVNVIVEEHAADIGDCVRVRVAGDVRISKRPMSQCEDASEDDAF
jgi:outer membrane lipoprotein SlyB